MKIVFIYNGTESLGIEYISAFLKKKGHQVFLLFDPAVFQGDVFVNIRALANFFNLDQAIVRKAIEINPDLIAFSAYTGNYRWCLSIAQAIKQISDIPIVFGGVHPTAVPERVLANDFIDFVIRGEGEFAMLDLIESLERNESKDKLVNLPNICFKHQGRLYLNEPRFYINDLDILPFPDKRLFFDKEPLLEKNPYLIMTSRGCPYNCTYCSNNMYKNLYCQEKQHVRRRSPDNVIEELLLVKKEGKAKRINFMDDVFTFSESWLEDFIEKYKSKINLPFNCLTHPLAINKKIAFLLKKGGCRLVGVGVQSGSERIRKQIYNRQGSNDKIIEAISYLKEMKLKVQLDHILGAPSENETDLKESLSLYKKLKPDILMTFWLTYYPQTQIIELAKQKGILSEKDIDDIEEGNIGYTHDLGSVAKESIPLLAKYELMFELLSLCHNDILYSWSSKFVSLLPWKNKISYFILALTGLKNNREYILNKFRYAFSKHKTL